MPVNSFAPEFVGFDLQLFAMLGDAFVGKFGNTCGVYRVTSFDIVGSCWCDCAYFFFAICIMPNNAKYYQILHAMTAMMECFSHEFSNPLVTGG